MGCSLVRSAYNLAVELEGRATAVGQSGLGEVPRGGWNFLWKSKVPGKVKVFAWRLCKKALPTCSNLQRRHCQVHNECPRCSMEGRQSSILWLIVISLDKLGHSQTYHGIKLEIGVTPLNLGCGLCIRIWRLGNKDLLSWWLGSSGTAEIFC
ncbi:hypothetical protein Salat_1430200 [Sesamum alatum]|uniref:Reverse transcriptase zinc-binding domain-containing protein n=1 Tax=Sesamum alatum TaxID=300844 RepID=A0AAE1YAN5_9LAMI|nr:hypothetical protein Salat_1430200 [Sesamum alatum]